MGRWKLGMLLGVFSISLVWSGPLKAGFKEDLLKSLIKRLTRETLSRILGGQVCKETADFKDAANPYCQRIKEGIEKAISGIMNKDWYSIRSAVKTMATVFLEKKFLSWIKDDTVREFFEKRRFMKNHLKRTRWLFDHHAYILSVLGNGPACLVWLKQAKRGEGLACQKLIRGNMLNVARWPAKVDADDRQRVSEYMEAVLGKEKPTGYLKSRFKALLKVEKAPESQKALLPYLRWVIRAHARALEKRTGLKAFLMAALRHAPDKPLVGCEAGSRGRLIPGFKTWLGSQCPLNKMAMLRFAAEELFHRIYKETTLKPGWVKLWQLSQLYNEAVIYGNRLKAARRWDTKGRKKSDLISPEGLTAYHQIERVMYLIHKGKFGKLKKLKKAVIGEDAHRLREAISKVRKAINVSFKVKAKRHLFGQAVAAYGKAKEQAQNVLASVEFTQYVPELSRYFGENILQATNKEKILNWMKELPEEMIAGAIKAVSSAAISRAVNLGGLLRFDRLGSNITAHSFEQLLYLCPFGSSPNCFTLRKVLLRQAALRSVIRVLLALIDGNKEKVHAEVRKSLMLVAGYFYQEIYRYVGPVLRAVIDLPGLALKAGFFKTSNVHSWKILEDAGACVRREYMKALLAFGFDPPSWKGRKRAVADRIKKSCEREIGLVTSWSRFVVRKSVRRISRSVVKGLNRKKRGPLALLKKILPDLRKQVKACGIAKRRDLLTATRRLSLLQAQMRKISAWKLTENLRSDLDKLGLRELTKAAVSSHLIQKVVAPVRKLIFSLKEVGDAFESLDLSASLAFTSTEEAKKACAITRKAARKFMGIFGALGRAGWLDGLKHDTRDLMVIAGLSGYMKGLFKSVTAIGDVDKYFTILIENLANTINELPMFSQLGDFARPVKKFLVRVVQMLAPGAHFKIDRKFISPFGREVLDILLKKLFVTNRKNVQPLLTALADLASNHLANLVFEEDRASLPQKLDAVKNALIDVFERKSEFRVVPGLQFRLGLIAPFRITCPPGLVCDTALKTIYREELNIDLTLGCSNNEFLCWGFGLKLPSLLENLTRSLESGNKGPKVEFELNLRFLMQTKWLSFTVGPLGHYQYIKDKFADTADVVGRSWLSVGAGLDVTFRIFGNVLAGIRGRYYYSHRTFRHADPQWKHSLEFGIYLGYGLSAVRWR